MYIFIDLVEHFLKVSDYHMLHSLNSRFPTINVIFFNASFLVNFYFALGDNGVAVTENYHLL